MAKFIDNLLSTVTKSMLSRYIAQRQPTQLKIEDFSLWAKTFGSNYHPLFVTPNNSNNIVLSCHGIEYTNIHDKTNKISYIGLFWIDEKYRGKEIMMHLTKYAFTNPVYNNPFHSVMKPSVLRCFTIISGDFNEFYKSYESTYHKRELNLCIPKNDTGIILKKVSEVPSDLLTSYDQQIFPYNRATYIKDFLEQENCYSRIALNSSGEIIGYGNIVLFKSTKTAQIQPLYAKNAETARAILSEILTTENFEFEELAFRSNDRNEESYKWIEPLLINSVNIRRELISTYGYSFHPPKVDLSKVFAPASTTVCPI